MARYFIDTSDGDLSVPDDEGQDFDDDSAARNAAVSALPDIARDVMPDGDDRTFSAAVRNADGKIIYNAVLTFKGTWRG